MAGVCRPSAGAGGLSAREDPRRRVGNPSSRTSPPPSVRLLRRSPAARAWSSRRPYAPDGFRRSNVPPAARQSPSRSTVPDRFRPRRRRAPRQPCRTGRRCGAGAPERCPGLRPQRRCTTSVPAPTGSEVDGGSARRIANRISRQVLQRLLESILVRGDRLGAGRDGRFQRKCPPPDRRARAAPPRGRRARRRTRWRFVNVPPPPSSRASSSRSPISRSSLAVSSPMIFR